MKTLLACVVLCASVIVAAAQPKKVEADGAYRYGQSLYMKEDYEGAAAQFKAAYAADPDPVYLFNVAQALRLAQKCKDASGYYHRYLTEAKKAPNEDAVKAYIVEVDECAKAQEPVVVPPPTVTDPAKQEVPVPEHVDEPSSGGTKRIVGYVVGGVGVGLAGLGFVFMSQISGLEDDAAALCPAKPCMWTPEKTAQRDHIDNKAHTREKLMVGSFIAGGAAIAAGVFLIVTGGEKPRTESAVTITPTRNGALATFRF